MPQAREASWHAWRVLETQARRVGQNDGGTRFKPASRNRPAASDHRSSAHRLSSAEGPTRSSASSNTSPTTDDIRRLAGHHSGKDIIPIRSSGSRPRRRLYNRYAELEAINRSNRLHVNFARDSSRVELDLAADGTLTDIPLRLGEVQLLAEELLERRAALRVATRLHLKPLHLATRASPATPQPERKGRGGGSGSGRIRGSEIGSAEVRSQTGRAGDARQA